LCAGILVADHLCAPIARLPEPGELVLTDRLVLNIGGCAANTAMDLARLGVPVGIAGCVGDDLFGSFVSQTLRDAGVETSGLRVVPGRGTSGTLIVNVEGQDRRYIHTTGANACVTAADLPLAGLGPQRVLYVGGYLLMPSMLPEELAGTFRAARAAGIVTVLDVVIPRPADYLPWLAPVLPETDYFLPNQDESEIMTGIRDPLAQADRFRALGAKTVAITCGGAGAVLVSERIRARSGVYRVPFVDGTGSGDAFDAGFIAALLEGADPLTALRWGSALGASCVQALGTTAGVFTRPQLLEFLTSRELVLEILDA